MDDVVCFTLQEYICKMGHISVDEAVAIAAQVADELDALHSKGIVHRDVKPSNIVIRHSETGGVHAMLVGFGIVKKQDPSITCDGVIVDTPDYMSPEQVKGEKLDRRSDQYSLAISLWEMLTGHVTFEGSSVFEVMDKHVHEPPGLLRVPGLDHADALYGSIDFALRRALSKDRKARFSSCSDFISTARGAAA